MNPGIGFSHTLRVFGWESGPEAVSWLGILVEGGAVPWQVWGGGILKEGGPTVAESLFEVVSLFLDSDSIQNSAYVIHRHRPSSSGSCLRSKEAFHQPLTLGKILKSWIKSPLATVLRAILCYNTVPTGHNTVPMGYNTIFTVYWPVWPGLEVCSTSSL